MRKVQKLRGKGIWTQRLNKRVWKNQKYFARSSSIGGQNWNQTRRAKVLPWFLRKLKFSNPIIKTWHYQFKKFSFESSKQLNCCSKFESSVPINSHLHWFSIREYRGQIDISSRKGKLLSRWSFCRDCFWL